MFLGSHLRDYSPPGGVFPPPEVVRGLREIDPRMELVYVGQGKWLFGKVEYARDRWEQAARTLENLLAVLRQVRAEDIAMPWSVFVRRAHARILERRLSLQGFQPFKGVVLYSHQLHSGLVEAFKRADWIWKYEWRKADKEREELEDGTTGQNERIKELEDRLRLVYRDVHRSAFRHPVSEPINANIVDGKIVRSEGAVA